MFFLYSASSLLVKSLECVISPGSWCFIISFSIILSYLINLYLCLISEWSILNWVFVTITCLMQQFNFAFKATKLFHSKLLSIFSFVLTNFMICRFNFITWTLRDTSSIFYFGMISVVKIKIFSCQYNSITCSARDYICHLNVLSLLFVS